MITIRTTTDVTADRQVVLVLPPETPLGKAELVVTVAPSAGGSTAKRSVRERFGAVHGDNPHAADNDRIDADLSRAYGDNTE